MAVYYSRYCEKCDKTIVIKASRVEGFSDYENVSCPDCKADLGEIRADEGYDIVGKKPGNHGDRMWEGHYWTQEFMGEWQ